MIFPLNKLAVEAAAKAEYNYYRKSIIDLNLKAPAKWDDMDEAYRKGLIERLHRQLLSYYASLEEQGEPREIDRLRGLVKRMAEGLKPFAYSGNDAAALVAEAKKEIEG